MEDGFKTIQLTKGKCTIVDADLFEFLNQFKWICNSHGYAARHVKRQNCDREIILMHNIILGKRTGDGFYCDHINGITLDNRRCNLRIATKTQNAQNFSGWRNKTTSRFKGVFKRKDSGKFRVIIACDGKRINVGEFTDEIVAARAYNEAAIRLHKDFARLNIIDDFNQTTDASKTH